jgi:carboxypeptidase Taq
MPNTKNEHISKLKHLLSEIAHLTSALEMLQWDKEINMPKKSAEMRAQHISYLSGLIHHKTVSLNQGGLLTRLERALDKGKLSPNDKALVSEVLRDFKREQKLPQAFVEELSHETALAYGAWQQARESNDFSKFTKPLERIVELERKQAKFLGYTNSPYDALLDIYEPGMTVAELDILFFELRDSLVSLLKRIQKSKYKVDYSTLKGSFDLQRQMKFNKWLSGRVGFDLETGRLDTATHPSTITINPADVRITTRYQEDDVLNAISSTLHEAGHGMYEQGLLLEHFGTPLGTSISLGIHESQSKLWENLVGRSKAFWKYFFPKLQKEFGKPFSKLSFTESYEAYNMVKPSLIRVDADEVTYNLHIIIRYEIEKALIEGSIEVKDLPSIWNDKVKEYLGIKVPNNRLGVLQDIHWSHGLFGYFPTYTLGNLYSAQIYVAAKRDILDLEKEISKGHFEHLREWLRKRIHMHGKKYSAEKLIKKVTGEKLNSSYFTDYLEEKYKEIYRLS